MICPGCLIQYRGLDNSIFLHTQAYCLEVALSGRAQLTNRRQILSTRGGGERKRDEKSQTWFYLAACLQTGGFQFQRLDDPLQQFLQIMGERIVSHATGKATAWRTFSSLENM